MTTKKIVHMDIDVYGREKANGSPYELFNEEAVGNALTLWLTSKAGDFLRNPEAGGLLDRVIFKNMHGRSISLFLFALKNALYNEFAPAIKVVDLKLERLYEFKTLKIQIMYQIVATQEVQQIEVFTKDLTPLREQREQDIDYIGYNLRMFCIIRKPNMGEELLIYNEDEEVWRWGIYKFTNFNLETDPYGQEILSVCND